MKHLADLYGHETELFRKDKRRVFTQLDKLKAWNRQKGKCKVCGKPVRISDVGHHVEAHAKGGKTASDNCWLLHEECHKSLHENKTPTLWEDEQA